MVHKLVASLPLSIVLGLLLLVGLASVIRVNIVESANDSAQRPYYIATTGSDSQNCSGGTKEQPFRTWKNNEACFGAGVTVYFKEGTYRTTEVFKKISDKNKGRIKFNGTAGRPTVVAADPEAGQLLVQFRGALQVSGVGGRFEKINFFGDGQEPIQTGARHISIVDSYIHGRPNESFPVSSTDNDCIKILNDARNIEIIGNEIAYCGEDCIDVTGAEQVLYQGNHMHHCELVQVKGGTKDITIQNNCFHDMKKTMSGSGMGCSYYCGSTEILKLDIEDRYVAKNVVIRDNDFYDIQQKTTTIHGRGWVDSIISGNRFYNAPVGVSLSGHGGFDFRNPDPNGNSDNIASKTSSNYCPRSESGTNVFCEPCGKNASSACWGVEYFARNVSISGNQSISGDSPSCGVSLDPGEPTPLPGGDGAEGSGGGAGDGSGSGEGDGSQGDESEDDEIPDPEDQDEDQEYEFESPGPLFDSANEVEGYIHPGIDIVPSAENSNANYVYSTHAGFVTYAGPAPPSVAEKGWMVQIESDLNRDNVADVITRYTHLFEDTIALNDFKYKRITWTPSCFMDLGECLADILGLRNVDSTIEKLPYGYGPYIARNQLLGVVGDTGSPGHRHIQYEIVTNRYIDTYGAGLDTYSCLDDPYLEACGSDPSRPGFFFPVNRQKGDFVRGPVYSNPGLGVPPVAPTPITFE